MALEWAIAGCQDQRWDVRRRRRRTGASDEPTAGRASRTLDKVTQQNAAMGELANGAVAALLDKSTELSNPVALFVVGETVAAGRSARRRPRLRGARLKPCLQRPLGCRDHVWRQEPSIGTVNRDRHQDAGQCAEPRKPELCGSAVNGL